MRSAARGGGAAAGGGANGERATALCHPIFLNAEPQPRSAARGQSGCNHKVEYEGLVGAAFRGVT